jgi:hypothetical protein
MEDTRVAVDINRIASSALETFLERGGREQGGSKREKSGNRRLAGVRTVALGVGLAVAARAAYNRTRNLDLERVAGAVEERLRD